MAAITSVMIRNAVGLGLFATITAGLIALTQQLTAEDIALQKKRAQAAALLEVLPSRFHATFQDNGLADSAFLLSASPELGLPDGAVGYRARQHGTVGAIVLPVVAPDGYAGAIRLILGIDRNGKLLGVRVLDHHETPGLGDQIEIRKSDWIKGFNDRSLRNPPPEQWRVKKRGGVFDQFTGATITPNAVVVAVRRGLEYFRQHRKALLDEQPDGPIPDTVKNEDLLRGR